MHQLLVDSPHKMPVMRKASSSHETIMIESMSKPMLFPHQGFQELDLSVFGDGGINMTGYQLVDFASMAHRNLFEGWGRLESEDGGEHISVGGSRFSREIYPRNNLCCCCYVWGALCFIYVLRSGLTVFAVSSVSEWGHQGESVVWLIN